MDIQQTIIIGIVSSIIASLVFYILMILIKPKFVISDLICLAKQDDEYIYYKVKVVNKTRTYITNIKYSLAYCEKEDDGITYFQIVPEIKSQLLNLGGYSKDNTDYAARLEFKLKKEKYKLSGNSFFIFTFQANHSFSNAMKIKTKKYRLNDVREGKFETGTSTNILSNR